MANRRAPTQMVCEALPWDSGFFGFPVARTTCSRPDDNTVAEVLAWCKERRIRCLYHSADPDFLPGNTAVASRGFRLVDIRHELEIVDVAPDEGDASVLARVHEASSQDRGDLLRLAGTAFADTRFSKDPDFPQDRVSDMYQCWLTNALDTGWVFVVSVDNRIDGFITCGSDGSVLRVGLLAVQRDSRGSRHGRLLTRYLVAWASQNGFSTIRVATQGSSIPALRTYEAAGFRTTRVSLWYHRWFEEPEIGARTNGV